MLDENLRVSRYIAVGIERLFGPVEAKGYLQGTEVKVSDFHITYCFWGQDCDA